MITACPCIILCCHLLGIIWPWKSSDLCNKGNEEIRCNDLSLCLYLSYLVLPFSFCLSLLFLSFLFLYLSLFLVVKLLYNSLCPSVFIAIRIYDFLVCYLRQTAGFFSILVCDSVGNAIKFKYFFILKELIVTSALLLTLSVRPFIIFCEQLLLDVVILVLYLTLQKDLNKFFKF